jgi:hypothetical protein
MRGERKKRVYGLFAAGVEGDFIDCNLFISIYFDLLFLLVFTWLGSAFGV